jgi:hypothetical protein
VFDESVSCDPTFQTVTVTLPWPEWRQLLAAVPISPIRYRLEASEQSGKAVDRIRLADALKSGQVIPGARLVRGQHVRLS